MMKFPSSASRPQSLGTRAGCAARRKVSISTHLHVAVKARPSLPQRLDAHHIHVLREVREIPAAIAGGEQGCGELVLVGDAVEKVLEPHPGYTGLELAP